jgi:hypothetical protein
MLKGGLLIWFWFLGYPWMPPVAFQEAIENPEQVRIVKVTASQWFRQLEDGGYASNDQNSLSCSEKYSQNIYMTLCLETSMKKTIFMGLLLGAIAATLVISSGTSNLAIATAGNPNTDDPNRWGEITSGAAQEDGKDFGDHASGEDTPRVGLPNILDSDKPDGDAGGNKHPSELGKFLCDNFPDSAGC